MISKKVMDATYAHICPHCGGMKAAASSTGIDLDKLLERAAKVVYKEKADAVLVQLRTAYSANIGEAVNKGYKSKVFNTEVAFDSPDAEMIRHLQANVFSFSQAKSFQQLQALTAALYNKDGHVVPFNEFKEIASRINNEMAGPYLETEYITAIGSAQGAARWVEFNRDDAYPNGTYRTVGDDRVGEDHRPLDGVTKPLSDPWWDTYWPPNRWRCRCDVENTNLRITSPDKTPHIEVPKMFATNLAKTGLVFPEGHPYYDHLPKEVMEAAHDNNPYLYEKTYTSKKGGGWVYDNAGHKAGQDFKDEVKTVKILADNGHKVIFLPEIDADTKAQQQLRELCLPESVAKTKKNPDVTVNGQIVELKTSKENTYDSISRLLRSGKKQADIVCLRLTGKVDKNTLRGAIKGRVARDGNNIQEVWIIDAKNKLVKYTLAQIMKF